jgi:hypothetical protein
MSLRPLLCAALIAVAPVLLIASSAQAATPGSIQVTGNQLKSALPQARFFGSGYSIHGQYGSGNSVQHYPALSNPARISCAAAWPFFGAGGYGETALAMEGAIGPQAYQQVIYQFGSARAASKIFDAMHARSASCHSYTLPPVQGRTEHVSQSVSTTHTDGHQAFLVTQSSTFSGESGSLTVYVLYTADGADLFIVQGFGTINNTQPRPSPAAVTGYMIGKVSALR